MDTYEALMQRCSEDRKTEGDCFNSHHMDPCGYMGPCPCKQWAPTEGFEDELNNEWHAEKDKRIVALKAEGAEHLNARVEASTNSERTPTR